MDFYEEFMTTRVLDDVDPDLLPLNQPPYDPKAAADPFGIPILTGGAPLVPPFDALCGGRSLVQFVHDLFTIPDKVEAVMDLMIPNISGPAIEMTKAVGCPGIWVGGWRSNSATLSPKLWDRFVWPYYRQLAEEVIDAGLIAILHLDGEWTRDLQRFRELPQGKCIFAPDGMTDIFKAKEILGDHMCIMGDVPAAKLSMGTPDEVYEYCMTLIKNLGPEGFILHSGCDIPANAKLENVQAMIAAATGK
jgi:uroporphyrinogen-III decarboxylase